MLDWQAKDPKYNQSVKALNFAEDMPDIAKQLQDDKFQWVNGKTFTQGEWTYKAKSWTPRDGGSTLWFVERFVPKPAGAGGARMSKEEWAQKDKERNARIDKAHQENLEVERAKLQELKNINETLGAILKALYKEA